MTSSAHAISRRLALIGVGALVAAAVSGCGRRGPLEPPPGSAQARARSEQKQGEDDSQASATGMRRGSRRPPPPERPKRDFLLDPLL